MFRTSVDSGSYVPSHWHPAIEIIYMLEGELFITENAVTRRLSAGRCTLINSGVIHATKCTARNKAILFQIPVDFISLYIPDIGTRVFTLDDPGGNPIRQTKTDIFKETLQKMQVANDIRPEGFLLRFNSLLFEILFQLYHNFSTIVFRSGKNQREKDFSRLTDILAYTAQNYTRPISIDEIAAVAFLDPGYFCRFFKKQMGSTFLEYQNELRLSHIYHDLLTTNDLIQTILERHGFSNDKLFRRMFRERFEKTPSQVRREIDGIA
ncbi:MAG: AraC family transcriptional regulator [Eubacterium sp.]|nr:AraC family transcriptional regulator [Eubacterium sp.]